MTVGPNKLSGNKPLRKKKKKRPVEPSSESTAPEATAPEVAPEATPEATPATPQSEAPQTEEDSKVAAESPTSETTTSEATTPEATTPEATTPEEATPEKSSDDPKSFFQLSKEQDSEGLRPITVGESEVELQKLRAEQARIEAEQLAKPTATEEELTEVVKDDRYLQYIAGTGGVTVAQFAAEFQLGREAVKILKAYVAEGKLVRKYEQSRGVYRLRV